MSAVSAFSPFDARLLFPKTVGTGVRDEVTRRSLVARVLAYPDRERAARRRLAAVCP
jgi:hypothetical protein